MPTITTFLSFKDQAEAAAEFYVSIFKNARILQTRRQGADGAVLTVEFELEGQTYIALNGGSDFTFSDGISLSVECETQAEIDYFAERLSSDGGEQGLCGWVKDKFGVSWQVNPVMLKALLTDPDPEKSQRVMAAMMMMTKFEIPVLERAAAGQNGSTLHLQREFKATPERVYQALITEQDVSNWMVPDGMTSTVNVFESREGGKFSLSLTYTGDGQGKTSEKTDTYHGHFVSLIPHQQVIQQMEFESDHPEMLGVMTVTFTLTPSSEGTLLVAEHQNVPPGVAPADNKLGWSLSFDKLQKLLEESD